MSNYCSKGHWENGMQFPCKQCEIESLREQVAALRKDLDEWKNDAINGGNAGYLREQLAAIAERNEKMRELIDKSWKLAYVVSFQDGLRSARRVAKSVSVQRAETWRLK